MKPAYCLILSIALLFLLSIVGCEAVIDDYDADGCKPTNCEEIGDKEEQSIGCCSEDAQIIYFCQDGKLNEQSCTENRVCDYDSSLNKMACIDE